MKSLGAITAPIVARLEQRMRARISQPGIFTGMSSDDYFADCCPDPSLTQSTAKTLLDRSPWHAWVNHPRLNPAYEHDDDKKFDMGNVAHLIMIGRGKEIDAVPFDDWRTKAAKEAREQAAAVGKLAVLERQFDQAVLMVASGRKQLEAMGLADDWQPGAGDGETVLAWRDDGMWCRTMIDWLSKDRRRVWDFKTTAASASPLALPIKMVTDGWDVQAAMHERGLNALSPETAGRRQHLFVCQETEEPFALTVLGMSEAVLTMGRRKLATAFAIWRACTARNEWPGYPREVIVPDYPAHLESRWLERELAMAESPGSVPGIGEIMFAG